MRPLPGGRSAARRGSGLASGVLSGGVTGEKGPRAAVQFSVKSISRIIFSLVIVRMFG